jgi:hypothetical protein
VNEVKDKDFFYRGTMRKLLKIRFDFFREHNVMGPTIVFTFFMDTELGVS